MSPDAEGAYKTSATRCHACAEQATTAKAWGEQGAGDRAGLYFSVSRAGSRSR